VQEQARKNSAQLGGENFFSGSKVKGKLGGRTLSVCPHGFNETLFGLRGLDPVLETGKDAVNGFSLKGKGGRSRPAPDKKVKRHTRKGENLKGTERIWGRVVKGTEVEERNLRLGQDQSTIQVGVHGETRICGSATKQLSQSGGDSASLNGNADAKKAVPSGNSRSNCVSSRLVVGGVPGGLMILLREESGKGTKAVRNAWIS